MKKLFKILLLGLVFIFLCSFNTPSEEGIKKVVTEVFDLERLSKLGNEVSPVETICNNTEIKNALDSKHKFYKLWNEKLKLEIIDFNQTLTFDKIEKINDYYKVFLRRNLDLKSSNFQGIVQKSYNEKYIALLSYKNNSYLLETIVFQEENPDAYDDLVKFTGDYRDIAPSNLITNWGDKLENIDTLYEDFKSITDEGNFSRNNRTTTNNYDPNLACSYAEKYALNYNPDYKDFSNSGGDCTNFVSQCLAAGGLKKTYSWKPYTTPWHTAQYLRNYLVNNNLASEYPKASPNPIGGVIQFFNPDKSKWAHSGIITYTTKNDYLYCCHTYNKLNYPLSGVYPIFYKKIRVLEIK